MALLVYETEIGEIKQHKCTAVEQGDSVRSDTGVGSMTNKMKNERKKYRHYMNSTSNKGLLTKINKLFCSIHMINCITLGCEFILLLSSSNVTLF